MQKTTYPFIITLGLWAEEHFGITHILLRRVVKNAFYAFSENFREKPFAEKLYQFFSSTKSFEAVLSELYSNCPEEHFQDLFISKSFIFSHHFRTIRGKLLAFCRKLINSDIKRDFYLSRGKIEEKVFLFWSLLQVLPIFSRNFWAFRRKNWGMYFQNRVLDVQRNISSERFLPKKPSFFSINFSFWADIFRLSVGRISAGLSKLQTTYPV